jgi:hypothetical protein
MMAQADFIPGRYELRFAVAEYFRARDQGAACFARPGVTRPIAGLENPSMRVTLPKGFHAEAKGACLRRPMIRRQPRLAL